MKSSPTLPIAFLCLFSLFTGFLNAQEDTAKESVKNEAETDSSGLDFAPAGILQDGFGYMGFVLYFLPEPIEDPASLFPVLAKEAFPGVEAEAMVTEVRLEVAEPLVGYYTEKAPLESFVPPDESLMPHVAKGLTDEQMEQVQKTDRAFIIRLAYSKDNILSNVREANLLISKFAKRTGALIWDSTTRELYTVESFEARRIDTWPELKSPDIRSQISVNVYRKEENKFCRAVTLGMRKFGLPDLVIQDFAWSDHRGAANLINLVAQNLLETGGFETPEKTKISIKEIFNEGFKESLTKSLVGEAAGEAHIQVLRGKWQDGDASNRLLEIGFGHYQGQNVQLRQARLFDELFGYEDSVTNVRHDKKIKAASDKAKAMLPALRTRFNNGLPTGEAILLKAPFTKDDGGNEWMWVEVTEWERKGEVSGILRNEPMHIKGLHAGMEVSFAEADVFDFLMRKADGSVEGNQTGKLVREKTEKK